MEIKKSKRRHYCFHISCYKLSTLQSIDSNLRLAYNKVNVSLSRILYRNLIKYNIFNHFNYNKGTSNNTPVDRLNKGSVQIKNVSPDSNSFSLISLFNKLMLNKKNIQVTLKLKYEK